jgi:hypothetical protein
MLFSYSVTINKRKVFLYLILHIIILIIAAIFTRTSLGQRSHDLNLHFPPKMGFGNFQKHSRSTFKPKTALQFFAEQQPYNHSTIIRVHFAKTCHSGFTKSVCDLRQDVSNVIYDNIRG